MASPEPKGNTLMQQIANAINARNKADRVRHSPTISYIERRRLQREAQQRSDEAVAALDAEIAALDAEEGGDEEPEHQTDTPPR